jgi:hypothetical protein
MCVFLKKRRSCNSCLKPTGSMMRMNELLSFWQLKVEHLSSLQYLTIYIIPSLSHFELYLFVRLFVNFHVCGYSFDATCWVLGAWRSYLVKMETFLIYLVGLGSMEKWSSQNGNIFLIYLVGLGSLEKLSSQNGNILYISCWVLGAWRNYLVKMETFFLYILLGLGSLEKLSSQNGNISYISC